MKVRPLVDNEMQNVRDEGALISFLYPAQNQDLIKKLAAKKVDAFGKIPRTILIILCRDKPLCYLIKLNYNCKGFSDLVRTLLTRKGVTVLIIMTITFFCIKPTRDF